MIARLLNPFKYIAGYKALVLGLLAILLTAVIAHFSNMHFPGLISVRTSPELPLWYLAAQGLSNWIVFSVILYISALLVSQSSVRLVDVFGTQALARTPYVFAALMGFSDAVNKFGEYVLWMTTQQGDPVSISLGVTIIAVIQIVITVLLAGWMVVLMYNAYSVSANLKGAKAGVSFIITFIITVVCTNIISFYLLSRIS